MANKVFLTPSDFIMESGLKDGIFLPYSGEELDEELETDIFLDAFKGVSRRGESTEEVQDYKIKDVKLYLGVPNDYHIGFDGSIICDVDLIISKPQSGKETNTSLVQLPIILKNKKEFFEAFITGGCKGLDPRYADLLRNIVAGPNDLNNITFYDVKELNLTPADLNMESTNNRTIILPYTGESFPNGIESEIRLSAYNTAFPPDGPNSIVSPEDFTITDTCIDMSIPSGCEQLADGSICCTVKLTSKDEKKTVGVTVPVSLPVLMKNKKDLLRAFISEGCKGLDANTANVLRIVL